MKKLLVVLFCLAMVIVLVACADDPIPPVDTENTEPVETEAETPAESESESESTTDSEQAPSQSEPVNPTPTPDPTPVYPETPEIRTLNDLLGMKTDGSYTLMNDIDLQGAEWTPFSSKGSPFLGSFDGNGFKIKNFTIKASGADIGFFGYNMGTIKNLELADFKIDLTYDNNITVGALTGYNGGTLMHCYAVNGEIRVNVTMPVTASAVAMKPSVYVGGLVGRNAGTLFNSYTTSSVDVKTVTCETDPKLESVAEVYAAGLNGYNEGVLIGNFATGNVKADVLSDKNSVYVGGLIGGKGDGSVIQNSYRDTAQTFQVIRDTYVEDTKSETTEPNCLEGIEATLSDLQSVEWAQANLWLIEHNRWVFSGAALPVLNREEIPVVEISTVEQLMTLQNQVVTGQYKLTADLDLQGGTWNSIAYFYGELDGNKHSIYNFKLSAGQSNAGFIAVCDGTVKNLKMTQFTLDDTSCTAKNLGVLIGLMEKGTVENCHVYNTFAVTGDEPAPASGLIAVASPSNDINIGTLAGYNVAGTVKNCTVSGEMTATSGAKAVRIGGLMGKNEGTVIGCLSECVVSTTTSDDYAYTAGLIADNSGSIDMSAATGTVTASLETSGSYGYVFAGGLIAYNKGTISASYANGDASGVAVTTSTAQATATHAYVGGLIGMNEGADILNCYASGNVIGSSNGRWDFANVGGLIGREMDGKVSNCFAIGNVSASSDGTAALAGGLIGYSLKTEVSDCYRASEQLYEIINTVPNPSETSNVPTNDIGTVTVEVEGQDTSLTKQMLLDSTFILETLRWSNDLWSLGTTQAIKLPMLKGIGASFPTGQ